MCARRSARRSATASITAAVASISGRTTRPAARPRAPPRASRRSPIASSPTCKRGARASMGPIDGCLASITCAQPASNQLPHACDMIILATAAIGAPCALTSGGLAYCADGLGVCPPGDSGAICTALPGDGAECAYGLCAPGLACTSAGTCGAPGAIGTTCLAAGDCAPTLVCPPSGQCAAPLGEGATCTDYHQCGDGLTCVAGTCATAPTIGGACASQDQCGADLGCGRTPEARTCDDPDPQGGACTDGSCALGLGCSATTMTCAALPGAGDPCLDGFACAAGLTCADGLGTCVTLPGDGGTCAVGNRFCADGLGCDPSDNTCRPGPGLDQPYLLKPPDYVCGAGLACDFSANGSTCVPIGSAGAACNSNRTCGTGTYCDFSTLRCTPRKADGERCSDGNECATGSKCAPTAGGFRCAPIPGAPSRARPPAPPASRARGSAAPACRRSVWSHRRGPGVARRSRASCDSGRDVPGWRLPWDRAVPDRPRARGRGDGRGLRGGGSGD